MCGWMCGCVVGGWISRGAGVAYAPCLVARLCVLEIFVHRVSCIVALVDRYAAAARWQVLLLSCFLACFF